MRKRELRKRELKKKWGSFWKKHLYPVAKTAFIIAICGAMIIPNISGALQVNADEAGQILEGEEIFSKIEELTSETGSDKVEEPVPETGSDQIEKPAEETANDGIEEPASGAGNGGIGEPAPGVGNDGIEEPAPETGSDKIEEPAPGAGNDGIGEPAPGVGNDEIEEPVPGAGNDEIVDQIEEPIQEPQADDMLALMAELLQKPEDTLSGNTVSENTVSENAVEKPFRESKVIDGIEILLEAEGGVFPEGAVLHVVKIEDKDEEIASAIEENVSEVKKATTIAAFDITVLDEDGNTLQPDTEKGDVKVSFKNINTKELRTNAKKEIQVFHVEDDLSSADAVAATVEDKEVSFEAEHFSIYTVVTTEPAGANEINSKDLLSSVKLEKKNQDNKWTEIKTNDSMSFNDSYKITYTFRDTLSFLDAKELEGLTLDYYLLQYDTDYDLPDIPTILALQGTQTGGEIVWPVSVAAPNGKLIQFAEVVATVSTGKIKLHTLTKTELEQNLQNEGLGPNDADLITGVTVGMEIQLNQTEVGTAEKITFSLGKPSVDYTINVEDNQKEPPKVEKSFVKTDTADGSMEWEIKVTNARNPMVYADGITIIDTIGDNHAYVAGSMTYKAGTDTSASPVSDSSLTFENNTIKILYTKDQAAVSAGTGTFRYKTKAKDTAFVTPDLKDSVTAKFENKVSMENNTNQTKIGTDVKAEHNETKTFSWTTKSGGAAVIDTAKDKATFTWTINVKNNGYALENVVIHDSFSDTMIFGEITSPSGAPSPTLTQENGVYKWEYTIGDMSDNETKTIIYTTVINNFSTFQKGNHNMPKNSAYITFEFPKGDGPGNFTGKGPTVDKAATNITTSVIAKSVGDYVPKTHIIPWTVTVNTNLIPMTNAVVTDTLPEGLAYATDAGVAVTTGNLPVKVKLYNSTGTSAGEYNLDGAIAGNKMTLTFNDSTASISEKKAVFTFNTVVTDPSVYANNKDNQTYTNRVGLKADGITDVTAEATATVSSKVIAKGIESRYDYDTHEIQWKLTVNQNKMNMTNPVITDDFTGRYLELLTDKGLTVNGTAIGTDSSHTPYYTYENRKLTIHLGDISKDDTNPEKTILYTTRVTDDFPGYGKNLGSGNNTIENEASLTTGEYSTAVTVTAEETFGNNMLTKSADTSRNPITYTIIVNQGQQELPGNLIIQDSMPSSLQLDLSSVKLYRGTINSSTGAVTKGALEPVYTVSSEDTASGTVMKVQLPEGNKNKNAYVLEYQALLLDNKGSISNRVELLGYSMEDHFETVNTVDATRFSSGAINSLRRAIVTKESPTGEKLAGAVFELKCDGVTLCKKITDDKGEAVFVGLTKGKKYEIVEVTPPNGYVASGDSWIFTGPSEGGTANAEKHIFTNKKAKDQITFTKTDTDNKPLAGAVFQLYKVDTTTTPVTETKVSKEDGGVAVSGTDGRVVFDRLEWENTYRVKEEKAPEGYYRSDVVLECVVELTSAGTSVTGPYVLTDTSDTTKVARYENEAIYTSISFTKQNAEGKALSGAEFQLYKVDQVTGAETKVEGAVAVSDANGKVLFENLRDSVYHIKEVKAPKGYEPSTQVLEFTADKLGQITEKLHDAADTARAEVTVFTNIPSVSAVAFTKRGSDGVNLAGAVFQLYQVSGSPETETAVGSPVTSDVNGLVVFTDLRDAVYRIKEVTAPTGYQLSARVLECTVDQHGVLVTALHDVADAAKTATEVYVNERISEDNNTSGGGGNTPDTPAIPVIPVKPQKPADPKPDVPEHIVVVPGEETPVTDGDVVTEIITIVGLPDGPEKSEQEEKLKERIRTIVEIDPHFFDHAPEPVKQYVLGAIRSRPTGATLPKTGGFWGSGIIYILGGLLVAAGAGMFILDSRKKKEQGESKEK
ncbi:MAG: SpaA isopeptide-forming pilin-related protein [Lachnospiraceae bacterium]|nr:SpaA isopeptide-forming pilin-related protein [Lachnospiraceae bacterium]